MLQETQYTIYDILNRARTCDWRS